MNEQGIIVSEYMATIHILIFTPKSLFRKGSSDNLTADHKISSHVKKQACQRQAVFI